MVEAVTEVAEAVVAEVEVTSQVEAEVPSFSNMDYRL